jgi:hypothetical protein
MTGAIILAICVFVVGLALAIANRRKRIGDTATFLAVLLTPLLVLGVASGVIQEFTGPGGVGAKFRAVARENVTITKVQQLSQEAPTPLEKTSLENFLTRLKNIPPRAPITFTFILGNQTYNLEIAKEEIKALLLTNSDVLVVIANPDRTFLAMADPVKFYALLDSPKGLFLIECISRGQQPPNYEELVFESLKDEGTSNAEALRKMLLHNMHTMAVTNKQNVVEHIAKRDQIVAQLVGQLASD